jgi:hypothetical protein
MIQLPTGLRRKPGGKAGGRHAGGTYIAPRCFDIGSLKIAVVAGLAVDCRDFVYPVTFTIRT